MRGRRMGAGLAAAFAAALAACGAEPPAAEVTGDDVALAVRLVPDSPRVGDNRLELELRDAAGRPVDGAKVDVSVFMHAMGAMPAMGGPAPVRTLGEGRYEAPFDLAMGGTWQIAVEATPPAGAPVRAEGSLTVGSPGLALRRAGAAAPPEAPGAAPGEFTLPPTRMQEVGVRSAPAERRRVARSVRAAGSVGYDESAVVDVSLKVRGWVVSLRADAVGVRVERGAPLFTLYSPEVYSAQEEYLQAVRSERATPTRGQWRSQAARKRLALWNVGPGEIAALERRGTPLEEVRILSPVTGTVIEKDVVEGSAFEPGQRLLRIVPLDRVWVEAQVYESEAPMVRVGTPAVVTLSYAPEQRFEGQVSFVAPSVAEAARTLRVRIVLQNPGEVLRPGMWATVELQGEAAERLVVPQSAVLHAGRRSFVFIDLGGGRFRPREVEVGLRSGEDVEVVRGLVAGERVVTSGTFLVAAESRLRAALDQW